MNKKIVRKVPITFIGEKVAEITTVTMVPMTEQEVAIRKAGITIAMFIVTLAIGAII